MSESWSPIPGYRGLYEVSSAGRIRRVAPAIGTKPGHILSPSEMPGPRPYRIVSLARSPDDHRAFRVARIVAKVFIGRAPTRHHEVNHLNGICNDDRVENLAWVTPSENVRHRFDVLRKPNPRGEQHGNTHLTTAAVRRIRILAAKGMPHRLVGLRFGISRPAVTAIVGRRNWGHVQ